VSATGFTPITLRYRIRFVILMLSSGLVMSVAGLLIVIGAVVLFRPPAILIGIFMGLAGLRLLRRYGRVFTRRQAAFQLDAQGLHYIAADGYVIPWSTVLGVHAVRRGARVTDVYLYLTESPVSMLFIGDADPRLALFTFHRPESPNQLHLRLSHFDLRGLGDPEAAFQSFAPRNGKFADDARILRGHLTSMNWLVFTLFMTLAFGCVGGGVAVSISGWLDGATVFALMQSPALLIWAAGRARRLFPGWATPRLILQGHVLYLPSTMLGSVKVSEILNMRYRLGTLRLYFTAPQEAVQDFQYNPYGIFAGAAIATTGDTRRQLADIFTPLHIWDNGKKPDWKHAKALYQHRNDDLLGLAPKHKKKSKDRLHT